MRTSQILAAIAFSVFAVPTHSGEAVFAEDGGVTWRAGVDGVEFQWAPDGTLLRASSRYSTPVVIADRRGIHKAQIIAEEKAKAEIIRTIQQMSTSSRVVTEVQSDLSRATQHGASGGEGTLTKVDERIVSETLTELTGSFAAGTLRGVVVLEKGYDKTTSEAWTVVGISQKTLAAASELEALVTSPAGEKISSREKEEEALGSGIQGSEVRRTKQTDW